MPFHRLLLRLYPAAFRQEYGDALAEDFAARAATITGPFAGVRVALAAVADVVPNAIGEHVDTLRRDLHLARRAAARAPAFTAGLIAVLALGIGANGAVFSILQAVLLQPLPYRDPANVVMVWGRQQVPDDPLLTRDDRARFAHRALTAAHIDAIRAEGGGALADVAAVRTWQTAADPQIDLPLADRTVRVQAAIVSPNFFDVIGTRAAHGRTFTATDADDGVDRIVVSDAFWRRYLGADPAAVGRTIDAVGGKRVRARERWLVTGVLPPGFRFTYPEETEAWILEPWEAFARFPKTSIAFYAVARVRPGISLDEARARIALIRTGFAREQDTDATRVIATVEPVRDWVVGTTREPLLLLGSVALLLLVLTCVTVANALLVRIAARHRELAVRSALGANASRLTRELLTQGAALAVAGTVAGTLLAVMVAPVLRSFVPSSFPRGDEIGINPWVFAFAAGAAGFTTVLATLAPSWRGGRMAIGGALRALSAATTPDRATGRMRTGLVGAQSAIATSLLIVAALLVASLWRMGRVPVGFDAGPVVTAETRLRDAKFRNADTLRALQDRLLAEFRASPDVAEVGLTSAVPFRGVDFMVSIERDDGAAKASPNVRMVDAGYFSVLRIPLLRGRLFDAGDVAGSQRVAVISDSLARQFFGHDDPLGRVVDRENPKVVIGVVGDVRYAGYDHIARPAIYVPRTQVPEQLLCLVVRAVPGRQVTDAAIRAAFHRVDPAVPVLAVSRMDAILAASVSGRRFYTVAAAAFAAVALALTLTGLGVTVSRTVVERQREIAIRSALGATPGRLLGGTVAREIGAVAGGALAGALGVAAAAGVVGAFLFAIPPRDPATYAAAVALLLATGAGSAWLAARGVITSAPATVLRSD
jgi:predicted permease